jgi:Tfp pilus assembly protein PilF
MNQYFEKEKITAWICIFLVVSVLAAYSQVRRFDFVNFDDDEYVSENVYIQNGITPKTIRWAFTTTYAKNWHPVTWLSHMLDIQIFGLNPGGHHVTSVLLHAANSLLLFLCLSMMSASRWRSGLVAALFALHPCHVESVAWISERKDVLCTFFWMLTLLSYLRYVRKTQTGSYLFIVLFFLLALLAKPMAVTLPFVLLLIDLWPLNRVSNPFSHGSTPARYRIFFHLIREKFPLFILSAGSAVVTYIIQQRGGAVVSSDFYPMGVRWGNALLSYVKYMGKLIWPAQLAVYYPYPREWGGWSIILSGLLLLMITVLAIRFVRRLPWLAVGWLWYLGTLVPVIGLIQVGSQAMADRYTYIPSIGFFIIIAWGIEEISKKWRHRKIGFIVAAVCLCSLLLKTTWTQVGYWRDSTTLFSHALKVTRNNFLAHHNLGVALSQTGKPFEAKQHYQRSIQISPKFVQAHYNLGLLLLEQGEPKKAMRLFSKVLLLDPDHVDASISMGNIFAVQSNYKQALWYYAKALRLHPDNPKVHNNLGIVLAHMGKLETAMHQFQIALRLRPENDHARKNLEMMRAQKSAGNIGARLEPSF